MELPPGFLSAPRLAGSSRPAGAFFSAVVVGSPEAGVWKVNLDGRTLTVSTNLELIPGQNLKLRLVSQHGARWIFQVVAEPSPRQPSNEAAPPLMAAFLSRGLPLATERLTAWSRWLKAPGPSDKDAWAASLESRGAGPLSPLTDAIGPWLAWQAALEGGQPGPPPTDEDCWDEWNLRRPRSGDPWLVMPLRWEYQGISDAGLLQAHWNPFLQSIDQWYLTAAPGGCPFRLEARVKGEGLDLTWRMFNPTDQAFWDRWVRAGAAGLFPEDFPVTIKVTGPEAPPDRFQGGVDVQA